jgi:hypothetical protein
MESIRSQRGAKPHMSTMASTTGRSKRPGLGPQRHKPPPKKHGSRRHPSEFTFERCVLTNLATIRQKLAVYTAHHIRRSISESHARWRSCTAPIAGGRLPELGRTGINLPFPASHAMCSSATSFKGTAQQAPHSLASVDKPPTYGQPV